MEEKLVLAQFRTLIRTAGMDLNDLALSDELLSCFLQAKKNKIDRAFVLFRNYHKMAVDNPNLMAPPLMKNFQKVFYFNYVSISPIKDEKSGCRVLFHNNSQDSIENLGLTAEEMFRNSLTVYQYLTSKSETRRILLVLNAKDVSFREFKLFGLFFGRKIPSLLNNAFPIRFYGIHILNEHFVAKLAKNIIWPFLSDKIRKRVHFHGNNLESFHRHVSLSCLPSEYGGSLGPIDQMNFSNFIAENDIENIFDCLNKQLFS